MKGRSGGLCCCDVDLSARSLVLTPYSVLWRIDTKRRTFAYPTHAFPSSTFSLSSKIIDNDWRLLNRTSYSLEIVFRAYLWNDHVDHTS